MRVRPVILGLSIGVAACSSATNGDACSGTGAAATIEASDTKQFTPSSATITRGQTVCWENTGSLSHTVTSDDGISFNHGLPTTATATQRFANPGSFPYHCNYHLGMVGTITVN